MYSLLLLIPALGVLALLVQNLVTTLRNRKLAKEAGCQPPWRRQHRLPFAIDFVQEMKAADSENRLPNYFLQRRKESGKDTWIQQVLGTDSVITQEPENISKSFFV